MAGKKNYKCVKSVEKFYSGGPYSVSPDGSFIVCACDETIKIVNTSDASVKSTIESDSTPVTALCISPNSNFLFSSTHSLLIRVWDLTSLQCLRSWKPPIEGHGPISGMACDASGGLLATGGNNGTVMVWDVDGGFSTHYFIGHKTVVSTVMFHSDPTKLLLFSASEDRTARIWDLTTKKSNKKSNKCIASLEKHQSAVTTIGLSEDGWTLLTAGRDKLVYLWDLHDYSLKSSVVVHEAVEAICVIDSMSPFASCLISSVQLLEKQKKGKGIQFITVGERGIVRGIVRIWDSNGAACHFEQKSSDFAVGSEAERRGFTSAVMLPSGQGLLTVTADQEFLFYSPAQTPDGLNLILSKRLVGYNDEIVDMKFLGEEEQFLAVATSVEQVRVYDLVSMSCSYVLAGHTNIVLSLDTCVSTSGRTLIVTGSKDNTVRLWDTDSKGCIGVGVGHLGAVGAVAFSKKSRNFFVSGSTDCTLKVWSFDSLLNEGDLNLKVKAAVASHDKDINAIAIAPNDSLVCSGSQDRTACIRRLPDLVSVTVLRGHKRGIWSVEFSPVDQCVITASGDKTVKIWAISDGSCLKTFEGHTSSVLRAFFVTRGSQFVSCGADGLVKLWTVKTNECIATYDQHEDKIWALAVGKKTEMLATGGGDAVVNLWHDSTTADKEEEFRKEEESVLRGQELENAVSDADYTRAIQIAFELRRPHKLFDLFSQLCSKRDAEHQIEKALSGLEKEKWHLLLEYVREWNIKPKLCHIAQFVLFRIFRILPPTESVEIKGIGELLEGLIPYSQRHFSRIDRLERSTYLLDYTLTGMSVIEPHAELVSGGNATKQIKDSNDGGVVDFAEEVRDQGVVEAEVNVSSKKRKSKGAKDVAHKKKKGVAYVNVSTIWPCSRVLKEKESK